MMRLALLSLGVSLLLALGAGAAGAARTDNGASLGNQVVQIFQQYSSLVVAGKKNCGKVGSTLKAYGRKHSGQIKTLIANEKHMSATDKASFAQVIVSKATSIMAQIQAGVGPCSANKDVQGAMQTLGNAMGGGG